jgi:hypothetical protein
MHAGKEDSVHKKSPSDDSVESIASMQSDEVSIMSSL